MRLCDGAPGTLWIALEIRKLIDGLRGGWASGLVVRCSPSYVGDQASIPSWIQFSFISLINLYRLQIKWVVIFSG